MKYDFDLEDHSKKRKEIFLRVLLCALEIGVVLFVAYAITHFGLEKMTVSGKYMSPTLKDGDEILINKMCYRLHKVRRNDVVVVKHNGAQHNYYTVERVIGLPGEKVQIKDGEVYIDGDKLKEKYKISDHGKWWTCTGRVYPFRRRVTLCFVTIVMSVKTAECKCRIMLCRKILLVRHGSSTNHFTLA